MLQIQNITDLVASLQDGIDIFLSMSGADAEPDTSSEQRSCGIADNDYNDGLSVVLDDAQELIQVGVAEWQRFSIIDSHHTALVVQQGCKSIPAPGHYSNAFSY